MQEIIEADDRYIVRGLASGTPVGRSSASIPRRAAASRSMSIDIVTVEGGKITHVHHLEDRTSAIAQLTVE